MSTEDNLSIEDLRISARAKYGLKQANVNYVSQLLSITKKELIALPVIGAKTADNIEQSLHSIDLYLKEDKNKDAPIKPLPKANKMASSTTSKLIIELTGTIKHSNFDKWKNDLVEKIDSVKQELITDDDFANATKQVKVFQNAEKTLKYAQESAINQAPDIQKLFTAINEIKEKARQARLNLQKQIKNEKNEKKGTIVQNGINRIQSSIDNQDDDFRLVDYTEYLRKSAFEAAIRGKSTTKGAVTAINLLCKDIEQNISEKSATIKNNAIILDGLTSEHKLLFPDRPTLLGLTTENLNILINSRITEYKETKIKEENDRLEQEVKTLQQVEIPPNESLERYQIVVEITSSRDSAQKVARLIQDTLKEKEITEHTVRLNRL